MNLNDYVELVLLGRQAGVTSAMNFVALVFAFFIMAYFVGASLSRIQAWLVSIVYSVFVMFPINGAVQDFQTTNALAKEFHAQFPIEAEKFIAEIPTLWPAFLAVAFASWLLSIGFLIVSRRKKRNDGEDA